ncbi:related to D-arabinitol 2-dehydrogenase [Phialocephala subalpina]|uniref:D-arabinitol 2-dehydrogenase [ribulose-forming] n=1 Tax=Phialocephala subalpina TaxID=576137 RepID=A0A1L7WTD4_9HELO|nr:related to D-arabinitol 2-dehydrogenase [Phialocephala subalpina]
MAPSATSPEKVDREDLTSRVLPEMVFSTGKADSMTAPPKPALAHLSPAERAQLRFAVSGNAIVTGGAGTLGFEAGKALLEHGLSGLMIFDVNPSQAQPKIDALQAEFLAAKIKALKVDITDDAAVSHAVETTVQQLGSIDILLCFAGVVGCTHALEMSPAQFRRTLDINTTGTFLCAQAVAKSMVSAKIPGRIIFTASISGHMVNYPQPQAAYNVSKAAVLSLKNCLASEWARYGIRVNSISPGYMDTILNEGEGIEKCKTNWKERNPSGRLGEPSELTGAVVLLASNAGTYINGTDIIVDGGQIIHS